MRPSDLTCPLPQDDHDTIRLAHGGGGRLQDRLIREVFLQGLGSDTPGCDDDSARLALPHGRLAFTTDSFVVSPLEFPGGDIGDLAVYGTVNDLAVAGAKPVAISLAAILEEGFEMRRLRNIVASIRTAADAANVRIVTGDTKVVERGKGDGIFLTTSGVGTLREGPALAPENLRDGDVLLASGDVGRHGAVILSVREGLSFETELLSDCAPLTGPVEALLASGVAVRCLRDLTRGGLTATCNEWARGSQQAILIDEAAVPVDEAVEGACALLGLDPFLLACEGRFLAAVAEEDAESALAALQGHPGSAGAAIIGRVLARPAGRVTARGPLGIERPLDLPSGEQLPRIC